MKRIFIIFLVQLITIYPTYAAQDNSSSINIKDLYIQDQADRSFENLPPDKWPSAPEDFKKISQSDATRRKQVQELLDSGKINTAEEYYYAAMIMQHGDKPDDYLMAHVLAGASVKLGRAKSAWLMAASLDRYLMKIGQPQIFGSQFNNSNPSDPSKFTNEPYNKSLISDSLRSIYYQPTVSDTEKRLEDLKNNIPLGKTNSKN